MFAVCMGTRSVVDESALGCTRKNSPNTMLTSICEHIRSPWSWTSVSFPAALLHFRLRTNAGVRSEHPPHRVSVWTAVLVHRAPQHRCDYVPGLHACDSGNAIEAWRQDNATLTDDIIIVSNLNWL